MRLKLLCVSIFFGLLSDTLYAQEHRTDLNSSEIRMALEKFGHLGRVLYMAAHPDDENTRLIAYLDNGAYLRTGYLSLTRGDGGQNLIGTEKGAELGLIRTQELLEARKLDRGEQFFTRAVDFGYSKNPEETFNIWNKDQVLADAVRVIRQFKPDVIVTRFPPTSRAGHGHHTASAMIADLAMDAAADKSFMSNELGDLPVHQVKRLYWNTSPWWFTDIPDRIAAGDPKIITVDVGEYSPFLGQSFTETAAESRSMHKSQGFGSGKGRGEQLEYLEYMKGDMVTDGDLLQGVPRSWGALKRGQVIQDQWQQLCVDFDPANPQASLEGLLILRTTLLKSGVQYSDFDFKVEELDRIILACAGIYAEAIADVFSAAPGEEIEIRYSAVKRSEADLSFAVSCGKMVSEQTPLQNNIEVVDTLTVIAPLNYSDPYWLRKSYSGMFEVDDPQLIGQPESNPSITVDFTFSIMGQDIPYSEPVEYKWTDRVRGEIYRPVHVLPAVTATFTEENYIFTTSEPRMVELIVKNHSNSEQTVTIEPCFHKDWSSRPNRSDVTLPAGGSEKRIKFEITPSEQATDDFLSALVVVNKDTLTKGFSEIDHEHIEIQTILPDNAARAVRIEVQKKGERIGYIMGAGDDVPAGLSQLGYEVVLITEENISALDLNEFQAVVAGVRAYNTLDWLKYQKDFLMEYVENGGNYIVQYNTNRGVNPEDMGPYSFELSRDRVTDETATVEFINPVHPILTTPNELTKNDFDGWVQERGLYFPSKWSSDYEALLRWSDPGEDKKDGALIVAKYGQGAFIYTGISFFREIPAGVPGAFRLLANIVSYEPN